MIATNNPETRPRRVGTMKIITNNSSCSIYDTYTELTVGAPQGTGIIFNAKIDFVGSPKQRVLRVLYQNESGIAFKMQYIGRIWNTLVDQ